MMQPKRVVVELPVVASCDVASCAYHWHRSCFARAITVGEVRSPACDTFVPSDVHCSTSDMQAGVGACKMVECRHNRDFMCEADSITVETREGQPVCATFAVE